MQLFVDDTALGEVAQPEDVANVIAFLGSGKARHATGATVDVNRRATCAEPGRRAAAFRGGPRPRRRRAEVRAEPAVAGRYGWHRDELYYAVAGMHLQGGYVEFPPVTALLAALARGLFGWSLVGLRAFTILASAGTVLVGALVARELGATRRAQTLAAALIGFSPGCSRRTCSSSRWPSTS